MSVAPRWLLRLAPLLAVYLVACVVYGTQAWRQEVPWLFADELVYAAQAREYARSGEFAIRGHPEKNEPANTVISSVAWRFEDPVRSYRAAKLLNVLLMAAACFPAYLLARLAVGRRAALFAAAGSVAIPGFVYASMILTEPLAYLLATTAFWLIARTLAVERLGLSAVGWLFAALTCSLLAWQSRSQLIVLFAVLGVASAVRLLLSQPVRSRLPSAAFGWLSLAAVSVVGYRLAVEQSTQLATVDGYWHEVGFMASWAFGAHAIGLAVLPAVLGLASLWPTRGRRDSGTVAVSLVAAVGVAALVFYAGLKGAYLYFTFAWLVEERNLIYAAPLLFAGTAIFLERRALNPLALVLALAAVGYAVFDVPYQLDFRLYGDAPGLAILSTANRHFGWTDSSVESYLTVLLALAAAIGLAPLLLRRWQRALRAAAAVLGVALVAATLTAELAASRSSRSLWKPLADGLTKPLDWVYEATDGGTTVLLDNGVDDHNGNNLMLFFNPNIRFYATMDGQPFPPGPNITPDIVGDDGLLAPQFGGAEHAVVHTSLHLRGETVRATPGYWIVRIDRPLRLRDIVYGLTGDGWFGGEGRYLLFAPRGREGTLRIVLSRAAWGGRDKPGRVTIQLHRIRWLGRHDIHEGRLERAGHVATVRTTIHTRMTVEISVPVKSGPPFLVDVRIDPTFAPSELNPASSDSRQLGLQPHFEFRPGPAGRRVVTRLLAPGCPGSHSGC